MEANHVHHWQGEVFPHQPVRQWVLSFPFQLRFLFASRPVITGQVLGIVYRVISMHLAMKATIRKISFGQ
jgi:hypothetical protein